MLGTNYDMTSLKFISILLMLAAISVAAFDVSGYLYSSETEESVSYEDFTLNGVDYSIVTISGEKTFLLQNDEIVLEEDDIKEVLDAYYLQTYYPSDEEIDELLDLFNSYNDSRNDGQRFPGKEEYACRSVLFIDGRVKNPSQEPVYCRGEDDEENCEYASMLMFQFLAAITEVPPVGSYDALYDPITEFGFASYGTEDIINSISEKLDAAEEDPTKMLDAVEYIEDSIPELDEYKDTMENNLFGWTETKSCDGQHWCMCPDIDLNDTALEELEDHAGRLATKLIPFGSYEDSSSGVYSNSLERVEHAHQEDLAAEYLDIYEPLNATATGVISTAEEAVLHVSNATLTQRLDELKALHSSIPADLESRNLGNLSDKLDQYSNLVDEVGTLANYIMSKYDGALSAKNKEESLITLLESKDLDPVSVENLELLKNKSQDLDAEFRSGMSVEELELLEEEYLSIADEAECLFSTEKEMPATTVILLFRGFAKQMNSGIATFAEETEIVEPESIPENSLLTLGLFSAIVFLSLASIALLIFLYIIATTNFTVPKTTHIFTSAFISVLIIFLGFGALMYLFLEKTSTDATLPEFLTEFETKDSAVILVDLRNASYSDANAMSSCASALATSFEKQNKTWTLYQLTANTCTQTATSGSDTTLSHDDCWLNADAAESSFVLGYTSVTEAPRFSMIYQNRAEINANYDYYESCPLVSLFS